MKHNGKEAAGGPVPLPRGFRAAGSSVGIKPDGQKDLALIVSEHPCTVAGVFTTNQVLGATVKLCRETLESRAGRGVVVNSGIANACTGPEGMADARRMAAAAAEAAGMSPDEMYVCSTGHIGDRVPLDRIEAGVPALAGSLSEHGALDAAEAIMTTDLVPKFASATLRVEGRPVTITGLAKGSGMIEPRMATMLAFLFTDAGVDAAALQQALSEGVGDSFNRISVDGDCSTNDTVLFFANAQAGHSTACAPGHSEWPDFRRAVAEVCFDLAMQIVRDGEGAKKLVTVEVCGARSTAEADAAARAVGNSMLVKTSWAGPHVQWGRVMDALGYSAAKIDPDKVEIDYNGVPAVQNGMPAGTPDATLEQAVAGEAFTLHIDLHLGEGRATIYSCDCTEDYVKINK